MPRKYTLRKRRDGITLTRVTISVTVKFIYELDKLSEYYNADLSNTLTQVMKEISHDNKLFQDFIVFYNSLYKQFGETRNAIGSIQKNYMIDKATLYISDDISKGLDDRDKFVSRSLFIRALISYFNKIKIDDQSERLRRSIENIRNGHGSEILAYCITEKGLVVVFNYKK